MSLTGLLFAAVFCAGLILAFARHPIYGLMTYIAVFYLHPPSRWWGESLPDVRWSLVAAGVTALAVMIRRTPQGAKLAPGAVPLMRQRFYVGLIVFVVWLVLQANWALDMYMHAELLSIYIKYILLVALIYKCIETPEHLKMVLWTHVLGCLFLGWIVIESNSTGRFEGFGGPDINEANAGALQVVTGIVTAAALLLAGKFREKVAIVIMMPFIVNALIATVSRSGFLAIIVAGLTYNYLTPKKNRKMVRVLSILAILAFAILTGPTYWERINSIKYVGEDVQGVDTGAGRLVLIQAQWEMFKAHPFGCGHRCTSTLSKYYLDDSHLTGTGENRGRSSHNTFMSLLVEQGVVGAGFYFAMVFWIITRLLSLRSRFRNRDDLLAEVYPAIAASLCAILIGDLFVDYLRAEVRIWFAALLMVLIKLSAVAQSEHTESVPVPRSRAGMRRRSPATASQSRISSDGG